MEDLLDITQKQSDTISRKFVEVFEIDEWEVLSDTGYVPITHSNKTVEYRVYSVSLSNGTTIQCADDHIFIDSNNNEIFAKDSLYHNLITQDGIAKVINVSDCGYSECMYDLTVDSDNHTYFTNGVLSHNTTVATIILLHYALFNKAKRIALLANKGDSAREILDRIQLAYENLPSWMQSGVVLWNKGTVEFENGSRIIAASSSSSSIRGKSMSFVYIDETAFLEHWDEFYASVFPTLSSGETTKMLLTSTPNGLNHFYEFWKGATDGLPNAAGVIEKNGFVPIFAPWYRIPGRSEKWKEGILKSLNYDFDRFRQEYEGEFLGSSNSLLSSTTLKGLLPSAPIAKNEYTNQYALPVKGNTYFIICDVSRGKGLDYSAFSVIDATTIPYVQVCTYRNNRITPTDYAAVILHIAKLYNEAYILVETNDLGEQVSYILKYECGYDNMLCSESAGRSGKKLSSGFGRNVESGLRTTSSVKRLGCSVLKLLLEQRKLVLHDVATVRELATFAKHGDSFAAEAGFHDDMVMGLVLFSFITQDAYFKDITNGDVLSHLRDHTDSEIYDDLLPFGVISNALDTQEVRYVKIPGERGVWSEQTIGSGYDDYH